MATGLNKVLLIGNLGQDAETRHTASGTAVTSFRLATTRRFKDQSTGDWQERTEWHNVVLWRGERVAPYLRKGKRVFVEGRLQTRSWEGRDGQTRYQTEVVCEPFRLMLLGGPEGQSGGGPGGFNQERQSGYGGGRQSRAPGGGQPSGNPEPAPASEQPATPSGPQEDDDIPF